MIMMEFVININKNVIIIMKKKNEIFNQEKFQIYL